MHGLSRLICSSVYKCVVAQAQEEMVGNRMKCDFCGYVFSRVQARIGCRGCPMTRTCGKIKCPRCGYESCTEIPFVKWLRSIGQRSYGRSDGRESIE